MKSIHHLFHTVSFSSYQIITETPSKRKSFNSFKSCQNIVGFNNLIQKEIQFQNSVEPNFPSQPLISKRSPLYPKQLPKEKTGIFLKDTVYDDPSTLGKGLIARLDDWGFLTIEGNGEMLDWRNNAMPWKQEMNSISSVVIKSGVTKIGKNAFYYGYNINSVSIAASVTTIGESAFQNCKKLPRVVIPAKVSSIGSYAFRYCDELTFIEVDNSNSAFSNDDQGILYDKHKSTLIQCPGGYDGNVTIPNSVQIIISFSFEQANKITTVFIPSKVTSINQYSFRNCRSLTKFVVDQGNTIYSHDDQGILYDKGQTTTVQCGGGTNVNITLPSSLITIMEWTIGYCRKLPSIIIPSSVITIGSYAFCGCESLSSLIIPASVEEIGDYTFRTCYKLDTITILSRYVKILGYAFQDCKVLTTLKFCGLTNSTIESTIFFSFSTAVKPQIIVPKDFENSILGGQPVTKTDPMPECPVYLNTVNMQVSRPKIFHINLFIDIVLFSVLTESK